MSILFVTTISVVPSVDKIAPLFEIPTLYQPFGKFVSSTVTVGSLFPYQIIVGDVHSPSGVKVNSNVFEPFSITSPSHLNVPSTLAITENCKF